jgi:type II secretory pathway pseudopilin PulG
MYRKNGLVLIELIMALIIITLFTIFSLKVIYTVIENSKVGRAKSQIANIAALLEMIKDDTGYYPVSLSICTQIVPPEGMSKDWKGPYCNSVPLDPWNTAYFYIIPLSMIFDVPPVIRGTGHPQTYNINFQAMGGNARVRIENYGIASSTFAINGVTLIETKEFHSLPAKKQPQIIEKEIVLQEGNNEISAWTASGPTNYYLVYISGYFPTDEYFILGSYGKNRESGGAGYGMDIQWHSDLYPNFQPVILK